MRDILNSYTAKELRQHISKYNKSLGAVRGYSKMKKAQLIDLMTKKENVNKFKSIKMKVKPDKKPVKKTEEKKPVKKVEEKAVKTLKEIVEILTKYTRAEPVNFICYSGMEDFLYLKVLAKHKNDCVWNFKYNLLTKFHDLKLSKFEKVGFNYIGDFRIGIHSQQLLNLLSTKISQEEKKKFMDTIMNKYLECAKRNKILVIPLSLPQHSNMLIFNPVLKQLERYEPHGIGTDGEKNSGLDRRLEYVAKYIKNSGKDKKYTENFRYSPSIESCPKLPKSMKKNINGLQHYDGTPQQIKQRKIIDGVIFEDPGGFCCMWSYLQMDYRLSNPSLKPNELGTELMKKFETNPKKFLREFIRGYTWGLMEDLIKGLGGIKILDKLNNYSTKTDEIELIFKKLINKMYKDAIKN